MTPGGQRKPRILVVNDDPAILDVFRELLIEEGYEPVLETLRTGSLQSLFQRLVEECPDVVVLDFLILGEQLGWQFLQLIKMQPRTARVPVVVCTAAVELVHELGAHLAKMRVEVVLKPFEIDDLYDAIGRALKHAAIEPGTMDQAPENS